MHREDIAKYSKEVLVEYIQRNSFNKHVEIDLHHIYVDMLIRDDGIKTEEEHNAEMKILESLKGMKGETVEQSIKKQSMYLKYLELSKINEKKYQARQKKINKELEVNATDL